MAPVPREYSVAELVEDLEDVRKGLDALAKETRAQGEAIINRIEGLPFLRSEVYEARHQSLRDNIDLRLASLMAEIAGVRNAAANEVANAKATAEAARALSLWAIGLIITAVIGAIVAFAIGGGPR